jgi:acyl carrier protein
VSAADATMQEEAQVLEFVNERLARAGPVTDLALDLMAARIIDSMAMLELVVWLEQTFGLRVKNEDLTAENFRSVAVLAGYIRRSRPG